MQKTFIAFTLCIFLLFTGCQTQGQSGGNTNPNPIIKVENAAALYTAASASLTNKTDITFTVSATETTTYRGKTHTQTTTQTVAYKDIGKESAVAAANKVQAFGSYEVYTGLICKGGVGYFTIADGKFQKPFTMQEFSQQHAPVVLLNAANYSEVSGISDGIITTISFNKPIKAEPWSVPENAVLIDASGSAILDENNVLQECLYAIKYSLSDRVVETVIRTTVGAAETAIPLPITSSFIPLDNPEALLLMEQSIGYLLLAENIRAETTEHILCESYSDEWTQDMTIQIAQTDGDYTASLNVSSVKINGGLLDNAQRKTQQKIYSGGVLTDIIDGGQPIQDSSIRQQDIQIYFRELLMSTVLKSGRITSVTVTDLNTSYKIEFFADEEMANKIRQEVCSTLYNTPTLLDACAYDIERLTGYITIDKATLLPLASGISYLETHYVADFPYHLSFETEQTYTSM